MRRRRNVPLASLLRRLARTCALPPPVIAAAVLAILLFSLWVRYQESSAPDIFDATQTFLVERIVDGDTLLLEGNVRVRLLGVDTPETKHPDRPVEPLGLEASEFVRNLVDGQRVRLEFDRERRDRYGRTLAFVYIGELMLNEEIVRAGYSRAETQYPFSSLKKKLLLEAEEEARTARRGLWRAGSRDGRTRKAAGYFSHSLGDVCVLNCVRYDRDLAQETRSFQKTGFLMGSRGRLISS